MEEKKMILANKDNTPAKHVSHDAYEYNKYLIVPKKEDNQCTVAFMEIPPGKAAYPYHYHSAITEVFYMISGTGRLETAEGERKVKAGDVLVFPSGESGSHKIWNTSTTAPLIYLDCDTVSAVDVAFYSHSKKVGLLIDGKPNTFFMTSDNVDYYKNE